VKNHTSQSTPPENRSTEFVAVQGGGDTTPASTLLVSAYVVMWALLLGFLFLTWRRQQRIEARLGELDRALARSGPADIRP
jgi:CcmD family protein